MAKTAVEINFRSRTRHGRGNYADFTLKLTFPRNPNGRYLPQIGAMPVPEDVNHLGPHEMRRQKHRAKTAIWARPDHACPGLRGTSRRVQLKGTAPAVTSAHEATTFWSTASAAVVLRAA
jgi:hypothetical protein